MSDPVVLHASSHINTTPPGAVVVKAFFDDATSTISYVVHDPATRKAAIIDSVLDYDSASGRTATHTADALIAYVREQHLTIDWLLETHVHADHLSAAPYLQQQLGGKIAIGAEIVSVQENFGKIFNVGTEFARDGSEFDQLFNDGDRFEIGTLPATVLHVPGHTPSDLAYVIGDAVFCGDTIFMPDFGTARTDFPGGSAPQLFRSIQRLLSLPGQTRLFICHDYKAKGRDFHAWETTVSDQRAHNVHVREGVSEAEFVALRTARDKTLAMPQLILPSVQVNMRAGQLPPPENNGVRYLKIPFNAL